MKKLLSLLAMMPLMMAGLYAQTLNIDASNPKIRYVGRTLSSGTEVSFDWAGTYLEMRFTGDAIKLRAGDSGENFYNVFIDKKQQPTICINSADTTITLANGLGRGTHTLVLQKRTEGSQGITTLKEFIVEGKSTAILKSPAPRERHIEFIGDSYTCGYGVEAAANEGFSGRTENCNLAHGGILARLFDADYTFISNSGKGVVRNYGDKNQTSDTTMQQLILRTLNTQQLPQWDFSTAQFSPDIVVIFLGINDYSTEPSPSVKQFKAGYKNIIATLRSVYPPEMPILCIAPNVSGKVSEALSEMKSELKDSNFHYFTHHDSYLNYATDYGADGHPDIEGQRKVAMLTVPYLSSVMGWELPAVLY